VLINVPPTEPTKAMLQAVAVGRLRAASFTPYTGYSTAADQHTINACRQVFRHGPDLAATVIFTRDEGMHSSGWWKNPDYERCEHLSLAFFVPGEAVQHDHARARLWCLGFFGADRLRYLWVEPPYTDKGKTRDVYHYRLFLTPDWRTPVLPRGEVYSKQFTELGWKSFSDLHPDPDVHGMEAPP